MDNRKVFDKERSLHILSFIVRLCSDVQMGDPRKVQHLKDLDDVFNCGG